jgi:hypothetical protein
MLVFLSSKSGKPTNSLLQQFNKLKAYLTTIILQSDDYQSLHCIYVILLRQNLNNLSKTKILLRSIIFYYCMIRNYLDQ